MRNLLQFLARYSNFLIFLILEVVAFILITTTHEYQQSAVWSSANRFVAGVEAMQTNIVEYFRLRKDNQVLAEENAYLKRQLMLLANQEEVTLERDSQYIYSHLDWEYIPAKVIDISTNKQHNYLTINKGARDSIEVDMGSNSQTRNWLTADLASEIVFAPFDNSSQLSSLHYSIAHSSTPCTILK